MLTDIKLSKAQLAKIFKSGGFLGNMMGNGKNALIDLAAPLDKDILSKLATKNSSILGKFESKMSEGGAVRSGNRFFLFISNEDMNDIIKIIRSLEDSGLLTDGFTETVKHEIKKQEEGF